MNTNAPHIATYNPWEVKARTKKLNKLLAYVAQHTNTYGPSVRDEIIAGTLGEQSWGLLAQITGTIIAGRGTRRALQIILENER